MASGMDELSNATDLRCEYTHHRDDIPTGLRIESMDSADPKLEFDDDGFWRCSHERVDGHDNCLFHLPASDVPSDVDRSDRLRQLVSGDAGTTRVERRRRKQLIGVELEQLDLAEEKIHGSDNLPLDLRCADIGELNCRNARLEIPVDLRNSSIDELQAVNSTWASLHAQHATIETMAFDRATLEESYFDHVDGKRGRFYFAELPYVNYHYSSIDWLNFMYADLGEAGFFGVDTELCTFFGASLTGGYFNEAAFTYLNCEQVEGAECHFNDASIRGGSFDGSSFDLARFDDVAFERVRFVNCSFDTASFDGAALGVGTLDDVECNTLSLAGIEFYQSLSLEDAVIRKHVDIDPAAVTDGSVGYVSLRQTKLPRGTLTQPPDGAVIYDLEQTTIGEVSLVGNGADRLMRDIRVVNTTFDGFDFRQQADVQLADVEYDVHSLRAGYTEKMATRRAMQDTVTDVFPVIDDPDEHALDAAEVENRVAFESVDTDAPPGSSNPEVKSLAADRVTDASDEVHPPLEPDDDPDPRILESTYQKAKNGATTVGHTTAAGRFFEIERKYRRDAHLDRFLSSGHAITPTSRLLFGTRWFRNWLMSATTGYGERPWRAIGSSFAIIFLFTGIYSLLQPPLVETPNPDFADYLVFSLQSFVAFIVGTPPQTASLGIRVGSALEGFLGAFFVALFVFTLTRTVHR